MSIEINAEKTLKYTSLALRILEKTLNSKFRVTGQENLPTGPIVFVANHFTRSETFFIPYVINKYSKKRVRCLADAGLYKGLLGKFLTSTGTVSTKQKGRDGIILKDLILGDNDWVIYPEGSMVKSKEIKKDQAGDFVNYTPYRVGKTRTGATVLALKSELYRSELIEAFENKSLEILDGFKKAFDLEYQAEIQNLQTHIVPLNITYYPIRPGKNRLRSLINRLVKKIPPQIAEEIEIETNLLLSADINIYFGQAINLGDYIKATRQSIYKIPIIANQTKSNFVLKYLKNRLTNQFMATIYYNTQINLDHIFSAILFYFKQDEIEINHLKRLIYLSAIMIKKIARYRIHDSILEENLFKIFLQESHEDFDSIFNLASNLAIITTIPGNKIRIDRQKLNSKSDFYKIRLENTLHVILNEFFLLDVANNIIRRNVLISDRDLIIKVKNEIFEADLEIFAADYQQYFDQEFSKDKSLGSPFTLECSKNSGQNDRIGVLICHGYKSCPNEVAALAKYINNLGFEVYAPRLKGHGTSPINIKDTSWQDWYSCLQRGYAFLSNSCSKIITIGFSTGALLEVILSSKNQNKIAAIILINAALKLQNIKAKMVPGITLWNEMLDKFNIEKAKFEYVDDKPENPVTNYSRNYLHGVQQLGKIMTLVDDSLDQITAPTLIIQAKNDPVINPISAKIIYEKISSPKKELLELDFSNHVIINGPKKEEVFEAIGSFINSINS